MTAPTLTAIERAASELQHEMNGGNGNGAGPSGNSGGKSAAPTNETTWRAMDLSAALRGENTENPPTILTRTDGKSLGYPGKVHGLIAEYESTKTWILCAIAADEINAGNDALFVDNEDTETEIVSRLIALGVEPQLISKRFIYVRPDGPLDDAGWEALSATFSEHLTVCLLDGANESMAAHDLDPNSTPDVAQWHKAVPKRIRDATGAAVFITDHVVKDRESRGKHAIGSQHKQSGIDVAFVLRCITPFGRGHDGEVRVTITKDRPGYVRGYATDHDRKEAATIRLYSLANDRVRIELEPPAEGGPESFRPTGYMETVSRRIESEEGLSGKEILESVSGKRKYLLQALALLKADGFVTTEKDGRSTLHYSAKPYREADESTQQNGGDNELPF